MAALLPALHKHSHAILDTYCRYRMNDIDKDSCDVRGRMLLPYRQVRPSSRKICLKYMTNISMLVRVHMHGFRDCS